MTHNHLLASAKRPLGKKLTRRKKHQKPLGLVTILGALILLGGLTQLTAPDRAAWVTQDFKRTQGHYAGHYIRYGQRYLSLRTPQGVRSIAVEEGVRFSHMPAVGALVEVAYTDPKHPRLIRAEDLRRVWTPDPKQPGRAHVFGSLTE